MIVNLFGDIRVVIESVDIDLYDSSERKIVLYVNDLQDTAQYGFLNDFDLLRIGSDHCPPNYQNYIQDEHHKARALFDRV